MIEIPEPIAKMIKQPDTHKVLTTVSPSGEPHAIVCASLDVDDNKIVVGEVFMLRTVENINNNPNVEFLVWFGKNAYSIKAKACGRYTEGPHFEKMAAALDKFNMVAIAVWEFEPLEIWDESASRSAGQKVV